MGGFEHRVARQVVDVAARGDADTADLRSERVGEVVAVEVERRDDRVLSGAQEDLLQERIGDHVLDDDVVARLRVLELAPWAAIAELRAKLALRQVVAPVTKSTFGELHDVALVHQGDRRLVVVDGVLDRLANQTLGAFPGHRLDADARGVGEADLLDAEVFLKDLDQALGLLALRLELNAGVDVFGVLAEDHHVGLVRLLDRRRHAGEILDRAQADVEVEFLTQRHIQ